MNSNARLLPVIVTMVCPRFASQAILFIISICVLVSATAVAGITVVCKGDQGELADYTKALVVQRLVHLAGDQEGVQLAVELIVKSATNSSSPEEFQINADNNKVLITSPTAGGLLYGACAFIEWIIGNTTPGLVDSNQIDIDLATEPGQARSFLSHLPQYSARSRPAYSIRGMQMSILALGVGDLLDTEKGVEKHSHYSGEPGGFRSSAAEWKKCCDWSARHRMNYISNWPYCAGTQWWEMACDPATEKMSIYTPDEIQRAAQIRESLFKYSRSRGLKPFLMNYVTGAPTDSIRKNHPELMGTKETPTYPTPFCLSSPNLKSLFRTQIRAILRMYPSLGGLHLRWWGESFPCACEQCKGRRSQLLQEYTMEIINTALGVRPDIDIIVSGWFRMGGTKEFAVRLPTKVIIQSKWGVDWEPTSKPNVSKERIRELNHPFLLSQCLPSEEFHSIGSVQYKPLQAGVMEYYDARSHIPNMQGLAVVMGEKDYQWITGMNYLAAAKLNWAPGSTDVDALSKNFIGTSCGFEVSVPTWEALDITQRAWEEFCVDFDGICPFLDCFRLHDMFGLGRVMKLDPKQLNSKLILIRHHSDMMADAYHKMEQAQMVHRGKGAEFFKDIVMQTEIFATFFESRRLLAEAFVARHEPDFERMASRLRQIQQLDKKFVHLCMTKPNIADDFELDGLTRPIHERAKATAEIEEISKWLEPENLEKLRQAGPRPPARAGPE